MYVSIEIANHICTGFIGYILEIRARRMLYGERQESRHPCVQPSACNTNSNVVCSTHTMLSQVLTRHCDIVSAHGSVRNQLSRATAARPVTHIHHRTSLFATCIIRNRYGDAPWHYVTRGTLELMDVCHCRTKEWPMTLRNRMMLANLFIVMILMYILLSRRRRIPSFLSHR